MPDPIDELEAVHSIEHPEQQLQKQQTLEAIRSEETQLDDDLDRREPTAEELATLEKVPDHLSFSTWLVAIVELCERFTFYAISGPFQNYMQIPRNSKRQRGALGLGQSKATALSYFFQFWCYVTPIPGAIIADTWLGRYNTICLFAGIYILGNLILFVTSLPKSLDHGAGMGGLIAAMVVIGFGTGGIKSNVSPLIADQYTNTKQFVKTLKNGKKVIVDPAVTVQTIFMIFYLCINIGSLSAIASTELEKHVDFWAGYLLPFCFFFFAPISLILGRKTYVRRPPQGTVIPDAFRVLFIGAKNKFNLDAAKPSVALTTERAPQYPWSDLFVDEVRRAIYACKVFLFYPIYWVVYGQMINNFVSQAGQMETHGIPNDLMQNIDPIAIIIFIPIMERLVYPALRKVGIPMKPITRIFFGLMLSSVAMIYAAIVQHLIYTKGPCYDAPLACPASQDGVIPNQIHVAVQTPAYFFIAIGEIMASITGLEYAYTKAPGNMKSFIMSLFLLTNAGGSALGIALSPTAKDPKLVWMFTGLAVATFIVGIAFWFTFRGFNKVEEELNVLDAEFVNEEEAKEKTHAKDAELETGQNV